MVEKPRETKQRLNVGLTKERVELLDRLKQEWGLRSRGDVVARLMDDLLGQDEAESPVAGRQEGDEQTAVPTELDDARALVLVGRGSLRLAAERADPDSETGPLQERSGPAIDLPGFVRRRSAQLRSSLNNEAHPGPAVTPLPVVSAEMLEDAAREARQHWLMLYGTAPGEPVLEAAMLWLGRDIWPQTDHADGRPFTWSAACRAMAELAPGWSDAPPSFERVMVTAGLLEDPFGSATLCLRIPTLIRNFVSRFRRRRNSTSFQTLAHTMTLQGALKLLQLPSAPGQSLTLGQIREAYRELALEHHPDSGGSVEMMRRLNEAYQMLKDIYRESH